MQTLYEHALRLRARRRHHLLLARGRLGCNTNPVQVCAAPLRPPAPPPLLACSRLRYSMITGVKYCGSDDPGLNNNHQALMCACLGSAEQMTGFFLCQFGVARDEQNLTERHA